MSAVENIPEGYELCDCHPETCCHFDGLKYVGKSNSARRSSSYNEVVPQTDLLSDVNCTDCVYFKLCPIYRCWKEEHEYFEKSIEDFSCKHFSKQTV